MEVNKKVVGCIYRAGIYKAENCKNHFKIEGKILYIYIYIYIFFFFLNDVAADVAQRESSRIKRYALAFSNI